MVVGVVVVLSGVVVVEVAGWGGWGSVGGAISLIFSPINAYVMPPGLRKTQRQHRTFDASSKEAGQL